MRTSARRTVGAVVLAIGVLAMLAGCGGGSNAGPEQPVSDNGVMTMAPARAVALADAQASTAHAIQLDGWFRDPHPTFGSHRIHLAGLVGDNRSASYTIDVKGAGMTVLCVKGHAYLKVSTYLLRTIGANHRQARRYGNKFVNTDGEICSFFKEVKTAKVPKDAKKPRWRRGAPATIDGVPSMQFFDPVNGVSAYVAMTGPVRYTGIATKPGNGALQFDVRFVPTAPEVKRPHVSAPSLQALLAG